MDTYDLASEERDREINFILSDRERIKIKQIDDALERLDEGSYGVCESCGLEVAEERLDAMPFTRLCRDCQQEQEREAKSQRRYDDERSNLPLQDGVIEYQGECTNQTKLERKED